MTSLAPDALTRLCTWLALHGSSCAELFGFVTGIWYVWLVTRERLWSWPVGVANALFYIVVFSRAGLYSDTLLQGVYLVLCLYGWWFWWRGGSETTPLVVTRTARGWVAPLTVALFVLWGTLAVSTSRIPGVALPWFDAVLVATSLVAQFMMTRKLLEHWILWIIADAFYVVLFMTRGLQLTALLYAVFLVLAVRGYVLWQRSAQRTGTNRA